MPKRTNNKRKSKNKPVQKKTVTYTLPVVVLPVMLEGWFP